MVSTVQVDHAEVRSSGSGNGVRHSAAIVSDIPATEQMTPLCRLLGKGLLNKGKKLGLK